MAGIYRQGIETADWWETGIIAIHRVGLYQCFRFSTRRVNAMNASISMLSASWFAWA
jgi:hypothetical protein